MIFGKCLSIKLASKTTVKVANEFGIIYLQLPPVVGIVTDPLIER
jgi:hypothetical protein